MPQVSGFVQQAVIGSLPVKLPVGDEGTTPHVPGVSVLVAFADRALVAAIATQVPLVVPLGAPQLVVENTVADVLHAAPAGGMQPHGAQSRVSTFAPR